MPRIFACLAIGNLIVLIGAGVVGLMKPATADYHIVLAVFSLLVTCLVQVLVFTYFTVSGKVMGQAVHLAKLDVSPLHALGRRKKTITRLLALVIMAIVLVTATGASHWRERAWSLWHFAAGLLLVAALVLVFVRQYALIVENNDALEAVLSDYERRRKEGSSDAPQPART